MKLYENQYFNNVISDRYPCRCEVFPSRQEAAKAARLALKGTGFSRVAVNLLEVRTSQQQADWIALLNTDLPGDQPFEMSPVDFILSRSELRVFTPIATKEAA